MGMKNLWKSLGGITLTELEFDKCKCVKDDGGTWLCLKVKAYFKARRFAEEADGKPYIASLKKHGKKRTLNANAYFWALCGKLSAVVGEPPKDIYREYIRDIGDNFTIIPISDEAKGRYIEIWQSHGLGWICEDLGPAGDGYSNIIAYYGSSTYDTRQMSRLIDLIVQDCKEQGIETLTPDEIALMNARWGKTKNVEESSC